MLKRSHHEWLLYTLNLQFQLEGRPHRVTLRDLSNWEKVKKFIAKWRRPLVIPFNRDNHEMVSQRGTS